jgi:hypothetical protein
MVESLGRTTMMDSVSLNWLPWPQLPAANQGAAAGASWWRRGTRFQNAFKLIRSARR